LSPYLVKLGTSEITGIPSRLKLNIFAITYLNVHQF